MTTIQLLLGNSDRRINNLVEAAVLDACFDYATIQTTRLARIDEFFEAAAQNWHQLIILSPDCLIPEPSRRMARVSMTEVMGGIQTFKNHHSTPLVAVEVSDLMKLPLLEAGVDYVLGQPFNPEELKNEITRLLEIPDRPRHAVAGHSGWMRTLLRTMHL